MPSAESTAPVYTQTRPVAAAYDAPTMSRLSGRLLFLLPAHIQARPVAVAPQAAVRRTVDAQVTAWNHCDLEGYMAGYWRSRELTFYAGAMVTAASGTSASHTVPSERACSR